MWNVRDERLHLSKSKGEEIITKQRHNGKMVQLLWQLGMTLPVLPSKIQDLHKPANAGSSKKMLLFFVFMFPVRNVIVTVSSF
jgi:hypothetical protein